MISKLILSIVLGAAAIAVGEWLRHRRLISNEASRKIIHITHALVIGSWPFFASYKLVIFLEVLFVLAVLLAGNSKLMDYLRAVERKSWGELFFPAGVIILSFMAPKPLIFLAAMLYLGLADGMAALVGKKIKRGRYMIFNHQKSIAGTAAFFIVALFITLWLGYLNPAGLNPKALVLSLAVIPLATTLTENLSPYGSDNLTIPLLAVALLNWLPIVS